jgi:ATP-dependent RNA helicase DDX60
MSFVPAPQASAANAASTNNAAVNPSSGAAPAADGQSDMDLLFKLRTYDVYWVEKSALMYRDGFDKVSHLDDII